MTIEDAAWIYLCPMFSAIVCPEVNLVEAETPCCGMLGGPKVPCLFCATAQ